MKIIFWIAAFLFVLNYFLYPAAVIALSRLKRDPHEEIEPPADYRPSVSLIIAAYNESRVIRAKIENSLALDYPRDRLEIIVVSDGSDDDTHSIATEFAGQGVVAMHRPERGGKSAAINRAVAEASGEILLLSDANNDFDAGAVKAISRHFFDAEVGAVTGAKHIYPDSGRESSVGDGAYWKYEAAIKLAESRLGSITSGDGEIFAVRKSLFTPIDTGLINDDAAITFDLVKRNYRVLYEPGAGSWEKASLELLDDYQVKVRMCAGGYQSIQREWRYLFPPRTAFALSFILHKILRWLAPVFLAVLLIGSLTLIDQPFYLLAFLLQCGFYLLSAAGFAMRKQPDLPTVVYLPMYFTVMNLALLAGLMRFLFGSQKVQWKKAVR